jgi:hypothetical protein
MRSLWTRMPALRAAVRAGRLMAASARAARMIRAILAESAGREAVWGLR